MPKHEKLTLVNNRENVVKDKRHVADWHPNK